MAVGRGSKLPAIGENERRIKNPVQTFVETAA